ncbi:hypothetical protein CDAR_386061 [Caerostris darwini]|uniref:Uncharacterized protein n=1 Tax=Caerostris darwini TaxID=1538125 RepID=A0AAV4SIC9_9ARAC|nr:hypothetical protein CDAR_386061 [Caerostris darwini]
MSKTSLPSATFELDETPAPVMFVRPMECFSSVKTHLKWAVQKNLWVTYGFWITLHQLIRLKEAKPQNSYPSLMNHILMSQRSPVSYTVSSQENSSSPIGNLQVFAQDLPWTRCKDCCTHQDKWMT